MPAARRAGRRARASARRACSPSSRLARTRAGMLVLSGSASELERDLPFSVFVDALDEYVRRARASRLSGLDDDVRTELAHVFPSLTALATEARLALQHERYRSHRAVRALLEQLAATQPLVLVLDDLHWADAASVELRRRAPAPAAGGARCCSRSPCVRARCPSACRRRSSARTARSTLTRIELGALSPDEARELLGDAVDGADATVLYEESGGNPFYLEQLARSLDRADGARRSATRRRWRRSGSRRRVAAALTEELALLSDAARLVLEGAAVAGDPFEPELAAAAAGCPRASVMDAVDELLQLDLLRADRRAAALPLPPPARPPRGLRGDGRRLAAGRPRAVRRGARSARRHGSGARPPRRALGARGRRRRRGRPARGRRGSRPARAGERRALVRRSAPPAPARPRRRRSASSFSSRAPARSRRPAASPTATPRCSRPLAIVPDARTRCGPESRAPVRRREPPRTAGGGASPPRRAPSKSCPTRTRPRRWR